MSMVPPKEGWYFAKVAKDEKIWIGLAIVVCLGLFATMILWHIYGKQNPSFTTYRTSTHEFNRLYDAFVEKYQVGEEKGLPLVAPDPNSDVFIRASIWKWEPVLKLKKGEKYRFHIASTDFLHGFSLQPLNMNFMVYPNYDYVLTFTPTESGEFKILCNEYCGVGHYLMLGKIIVEE